MLVGPSAFLSSFHPDIELSVKPLSLIAERQAEKRFTDCTDDGKKEVPSFVCIATVVDGMSARKFVE